LKQSRRSSEITERNKSVNLNETKSDGAGTYYALSEIARILFNEKKDKEENPFNNFKLCFIDMKL